MDVDWGVQETVRRCWPAACWSFFLLV